MFGRRRRKEWLFSFLDNVLHTRAHTFAISMIFWVRGVRLRFSSGLLQPIAIRWLPRKSVFRFFLLLRKLKPLTLLNSFSCTSPASPASNPSSPSHTCLRYARKQKDEGKKRSNPAGINYANTTREVVFRVIGVVYYLCKCANSPPKKKLPRLHRFFVSFPP